ncbi:allantoate amidohydrolase [Serratia entomophila]|uniref:Allantoate amidohydrolase n=1 Tax=Serratia entomophila TaxID=42906 RepID=A0ABY5CUI0_9GAMM|nr:allantoate amidohydrolase [Serratia entomophila]USV01813.1 allantoate amidohydrolase [Serratia entomophila]CAI0695777.1 allantoate amidohydrolase [Serratia entomophila]CAI0791408.1 allantoate amidohydrolase [Serratia entomophila]CAI0829995.1 allantoate amidohydrolase [Serratia entomophila]CAI1007784.1 allantoate amidohydrolase [Serratia entomophila]
MAPLTAQEAEQAAAQVMARCDALAAITAVPGQLTRTYLSPEHQRANLLVGDWMRSIGMAVWQDSVGNICGRYEGQTPGAPALLLGSHLDTVRNAGRYDGMLGVLAALEVVAHLHRRQRRLPVAVEVIGFADEEGTRFSVALLGSRGITGRWPEEWLARTDADGVSVAQALRDFGLDPAAIGQARRAPGDICAYLELHIEQGPCLEAAGLALGVVTAINGARRLNCTFTGLAGHAGTVPMGQRKDALAAAAEWMVAVEAVTAAADPHLVATVGCIESLPGAVNVIPGEVKLTLDVRGPEDGPLARLLAQLLQQALAICERRGLQFASEEFYRIDATACDAGLQRRWHDGVRQVQGSSMALPSGAGHDAIALAAEWPVGMLFVRCDRGISHHPAEAVTASDVALAIRAYCQTVASWGNA